MSIGNLIRLARNRVFGIKDLSISPHLSKRHTSATSPTQLEESLKANYFSQRSAEYLLTPEGIYDWEDHTHRRLKRARSEVVPWVSDSATLEGKVVVEVGCGTGSSTVAFAEQGARVIATEVDAASLKVAETRLRSHGLSADLRLQSGPPLHSADIVVLYAVLEHMTLSERISTLKEVWNSLSVGGIIVVVETPNRLWFSDRHTSLINTFHWLPDDLALLYVNRSARNDFNGITTSLELARWGRGVSFHDFEVALECQASEIPVISSLTEWARKKTNSDRIGKSNLSRRWENIIREIEPNIHPGFRFEYLDLILRKSNN